MLSKCCLINSVNQILMFLRGEAPEQIGVWGGNPHKSQEWEVRRGGRSPRPLPARRRRRLMVEDPLGRMIYDSINSSSARLQIMMYLVLWLFVNATSHESCLAQDQGAQARLSSGPGHYTYDPPWLGPHDPTQGVHGEATRLHPQRWDANRSHNKILCWARNWFGMCLECFFLYRLWTRVGWMFDIFCTCLGYFLDMFGTCLGLFFDLFETCVGHVLDMFGTCFGHVLGMLGQVLVNMFDKCGSKYFQNLKQSFCIHVVKVLLN